MDRFVLARQSFRYKMLDEVHAVAELVGASVPLGVDRRVFPLALGNHDLGFL